MQIKVWQIQPNIEPPSNLLPFVNNEKVAAAYLMRLGISNPVEIDKYLNPDPKNLTDPFELPDMFSAVERVIRAIENKETIGIWGDFDADGQTSTVILVECLRSLGANVYYYLPVRVKETHGISLPSLKTFLSLGIQLLISCDTGIAAHGAVEYANSKEVDVIITDHHALPDKLPTALACVNPRRLDESHPLATLSGSGTAFELMLAVCRRKNLPELAFKSIDLAALGIIADLAILQKDARLITQLGLQRMRENPRMWLQAMMKAANISINSIDEQTIGFLIAPRLNAFGRLDDANPLVEFLMDTDQKAIPGTAQKLEQVNSDRRWLSRQVGESALDQYRRQKEIWNDPVIILSNPAWPGGVLGLAASHLVTELNRPTILLNESEDGQLRGSARSIEGINIIEAISSASHLLEGFGGHPMAAGMSLKMSNLAEFRLSINQWVKEKGYIDLEPEAIEIDAEIGLSSLTKDLYSNLQKLAPFGIGNPPLILCSRSLQIVSSRALGRGKEHYKFILEDANGNTFPAVWWNAEIEHLPPGKFDLAFSLRENYYKGESNIQLEWIDFQIRDSTQDESRALKSFQLIDLRSTFDSIETAIKKVPNQNYLIYQEPPASGLENAVGRTGLFPVDCLILASLPPSLQEIQKIIQITHPKMIILAFEKPAKYSVLTFLKQLSGFIIYAIRNREGVANISELAEAANTREDTIKAGISWLVADGKINIHNREDNIYTFSFDPLIKNLTVKSDAEKTLIFTFQESQAFQNYFYVLSIEEINSLLSVYLIPPKQKNKKTMFT
jgi:single-stranded-DNA-specific exonuclease